MGLNCGCPAGASLTTIPYSECKETLGQVQKVIFQRIYSENNGAIVKNTISATNIASKAAMMALMAATDGTKIVVSPYIQNPTTEPGELRTFGSGNQVLGGIPIVLGSDSTAFTGIIYQEPQTVIAAMKTLVCENVGVYLIDEYGNIAAQDASTTSGSTTTVAYAPIPIGQLFVGDKKLGGYEEPDSNAIAWRFFPNWSDTLAIAKAADFDYNPLVDLVPASE